MRRAFFLALFALAFVSAAHAQLSVGLDIKRRTYLRHEPILATVTISNLAGRDIMLEDGASPWFGFTVEHGSDRTVLSPRNPDYQLDPLELKLGETVKRTINLLDIYPISELGLYNIHATIYFAAADKYFRSRPDAVDIEDGRTLWRQSVGVPETFPNAGATHEFSLVSAVGGAHNYLYVRIREPDTGKVFGCYRIGPHIDGAQPQLQFDTTNTLHALTLNAPKTYTLTQIGVNGQIYGQWVYDAPKYRPALRRDETGNLAIVGATQRKAPAANATPAPKLSDRPAGLPR